MIWEKQLDNIRSGNAIIETSESGIPQIAVNAPFYELMQLLAALTAGYNANSQRLKALMAIAKPMIEKDRKQ